MMNSELWSVLLNIIVIVCVSIFGIVFFLRFFQHTLFFKRKVYDKIRSCVCGKKSQSK